MTDKKKDNLIHRQLDERRSLQQELGLLHSEQHEDIAKLKEAIFSNLLERKIKQMEAEFDQILSKPEQDFDFER